MRYNVDTHAVCYNYYCVNSACSLQLEEECLSCGLLVPVGDLPVHLETCNTLGTQPRCMYNNVIILCTCTCAK